MKFNVNSQLFVKQLSALSGVLTNSNTVPIINCFHFSIEGNELTVRATDLETTLVTRIEVIGVEDNMKEIAVPSKLLLDILKSMDDMPMNFSTDPQNFGIEISSGEGKYRLAGKNPETFPAMPNKENTKSVIIPSTGLANAISNTIFAASTDEMRPQMSGIFCELTPDGATFVATDAHKLVRYRRDDIMADESTNFILPRKPMALVKNILGNKKDECEVMMEYNNTNVFISFDNFYIICRLVDGKYPNYEAVIPKENPNKLTIERSTFMNTLRRVGLFANQSTHQIRLTINANELVISAEDSEFSNDATEKIPCSYEGSPMEIGFNAKFLNEMISNLATTNILMELSQPSRAGILIPINEEEETHENILMLVMPVMLGN